MAMRARNSEGTEFGQSAYKLLDTPGDCDCLRLVLSRARLWRSDRLRVGPDLPEVRLHPRRVQKKPGPLIARHCPKIGRTHHRSNVRAGRTLRSFPAHFLSRISE